MGGHHSSPFQNLSAFGVDQLNAQRMFCCRNAKDARKAMIASSGALLLTLLMLFVGAGLFAYYEPMRLAGSEPSIFSSDTNTVFPVWIVTELPVGLSRFNSRRNFCSRDFKPRFNPSRTLPDYLGTTQTSKRRKCGEEKTNAITHSCSCLGNFVIYFCH